MTKITTDEADIEIIKLKTQLEEVRTIIREYLNEFDTPVKDYALRILLRKKMQTFLNET